ncbi:hypothetical protein BZG00_10690 [Salinivibrio kushneri]|uniref:Glycosyltransferase n=1 Tax=Salinivibrio kushneri TaxID=1908198 RepID=A0AB36JUN5_9GAMM|nr:glycosyltransferase [Salinivibrio kushneri]OOE39345.1 hypothetical protein BZG00_10690 [Salinivibrio kushneri]QCP02421.1 glycosyltransferase [Salinivibrio kushneri]
MDNLIQRAIELASQKKTPYYPIKQRLAYMVSHGQSYASNGYAIRTQTMAETLNQNGIDTFCFVRPGRPWELNDSVDCDYQVTVDGVRYFHSPWLNTAPDNEQAHLKASVERFVELFQIYRPASVLAASDYRIGLPAWVAAMQLGLPFYNEVRGFWELSKDAREPGYASSEQGKKEGERNTFVAKQAAKVFTLNQPMVDELIARGVTAENLSIVPNGVNTLPTLREPSAALKAALGIKTHDRVIGYIGSMGAYEGLETLIGACQQLVDQGENIKLLLVGDEQAVTPSTTADKSHNEKSWLIQMGRVPHDTVPDYYALLDAVVIPRKPLPVSQLVPPMKATEALAYGKRLVVSDVAPLAEYADKYESVISFKAGNIESLVSSLQASLKLPTPQSSVDLLFSTHIQPMVRALKDEARIMDHKEMVPEAIVMDLENSVHRHKAFNEGINRESPILKLFFDSTSVSQEELRALIGIYLKNIRDLSRVKLVVYGENFDETFLNDSFLFETVLFETSKKRAKRTSYDVNIVAPKSLPVKSVHELNWKNFRGFCESISHLFRECSTSNILYFVFTTGSNTEAGYHRRSLHLKEAFDEIGVKLPLISYHSSTFKYKDKVAFIPKDMKILERILAWLSPRTVIAASNHENAKPILDLRDSVGYEFVYEMRGLWHETYAAKMMEVDKTYAIKKDKNYKKGLNGELDIIQRADKVLFICKEMKEYVEERVTNKEINSEIVGNGYKVNDLTSDVVNVKPYNKKSGEPFIIGYFGSITYYEGIKFMLDSVAELIKEGVNVKVLLIGKNSIRHKHVLNLDNYDFVQHEEFKKDILPYYEKINLFVVPRLPYEVCHSVEPLKPFDCFAKKVPLLLSDCKALKRLSGGDERCLTFKSGDKESFKEKVRTVIADGYPKEKLDVARNWVNEKLKWVNVAKTYVTFLTKEKKDIYYLYADKWWISYQWSGASINAINEMAVLSKDNNVYYNDIFVNDLFYGGVFDERKYLERHSREAKERKGNYSHFLPKVFRPTRHYDAAFYRSGSNEKCVNFFLKEVPEPKIFSHNYVKDIWEEGATVGFQTESSQELAIKNELANFDDDGTLGYVDSNFPPEQSFLRYQASAHEASESSKVFDSSRRNRLKKELNCNFLIGVIGTIYKGTYPDLLISAVEKIRTNHPELNAKIIFYSINILDEIPKKDWIIISKYDKESQEDALLQLDVIVNTWKSSAQVYSGSNKNIDAINHAIPLIAAKTPSYVEQLGESYPLFYDFDPSNENQESLTSEYLEDLLIKCSEEKFRENVSKYLMWRRSFLSIDSTSWLYNKQISRLRKKVLLVAQNFNVGGVQKYSVQLIKSISECDITILVSEKVSDEKIEELRKISSNIKIEYFVDGEFSLLENFDVAFINSFPVKGPELVSLLNHLNKCGSRVYPIVHSDIHPFTVEISKHLSLIDGLVTINAKIIEKIKENTGRDFKSHFSHITPVLEPENSRLDSHIAKSNRSKKIAFFGRVAPLKCVDFLARSFARYVVETSSEYQLLICGPLAHKGLDIVIEKANLHAERDAILIKNRSFDASERESLFRSVDALVYTTATEGLPYTFLEANELGTPVISSEVGAVSHLIDDGINGLTFNFRGLYLRNLYEEKPYNKLAKVMKDNEEENYQEFKRVMLRFESDDQAFFEMSKKAISFVNSSFSFEVMKSKFRHLVYNRF